MINDYKPYFDIQLHGEVVLLTVAGLWDITTAKAYQDYVIQLLETIPNKRVFSIVNLRHWSIPSLEVHSIVNATNKLVTQKLRYEHHAIIAPLRHKKLFTEISQDFNHADMDIQTRAFLNYEDAVEWGKSLGYDFTQIPDDYIEKLDLKLY